MQSEGVELNMAAMLDMAFQLLTFFILTFRPAPIEGQLLMHLPPAQPTTNVKATAMAGADEKNKNPAAGLNTLVISVFPDAGGYIDSLALGENKVQSLPQLNSQLKSMFGDPDLMFDQVVVQVGDRLRYDELMKVMDVCSQQKLHNGRTLSKLSFVELPTLPAK